MSVKELAQAIGRQGLLHVDKLQFAVTVTDARVVFNRVDWLVSPTNGSGSQWVDSNRVKLEPLTF